MNDSILNDSIANSVAQEIAGKVTETIQSEKQNMLQQMLDDYGLAVDIGAVVVIVVLIQMVKKSIKKKLHPVLVSWSPLFASSIVSVFFSDAIYNGEGMTPFQRFLDWGQQTLMLSAGCFILYNLILERFLKKSK